MWQELNSPDSFDTDWYGESTNQYSHTLLGCICAGLWCVISFALTGEMPVREVVFSGIAISYLSIELFVQKWKHGDSWFDSLMVCCGAAAVLLPFREAAIDDGIIILSFHPGSWAAVFSLWSIALTLRVRRRYLASGATKLQ